MYQSTEPVPVGTAVPPARRRSPRRVSMRRLPYAVLKHRTGAAGKCADRATADRWFPPDPDPRCPDEGERAAYEDYARALCAGCQVIGECLELALRDESQPDVQAHGVFGGLAPWVREALVRARLAVAS